ncbi:hypothetical protein L0Y46_04285 [bacterium]|nr:hypothetical protein [bacterium]
MEILASTLDIIGKVMVAYTALAVHGRVRKEQRVDASVFRAMKWEKIMGITGIILMVFGYLIHLLLKS